MDNISQSIGGPPDGAEATGTVLDEFVSYGLRRASNAVQSDLARALRDIDLRLVTMSVLVVIAENPGLRQSQLSDILSIERPNLVSILDELESRSLMSRTRVPTDRRAYALSVTEEGQALADRALEVTREHEERVFGGLDAATRRLLRTAILQVRFAAGG
ncbi:MarR family winged helix-turn-helix transcriptional regulator [Roseivivax isoporae]|uniref:HTH marR-type domain-containing protein n=1 Tax=Roseivivax isoporae LMG 25204 TaxID=1449351 RepID=X7F6F4_9RHOB|nr:MarR family transcriptional regulator [Roseivivax isoporae]ETX27666.1 hypothetical protein RISW2_12025 [Roseivivax isoporae LMG 25204]